MRIGLVCGAAVAALLSGPAGASVVISTAPTSNMSCSGGVCTATAANAVLNVSDLQSMLASGNASVVSGSVASDIGVETALGWASANRLTLDAFHGIAFDAPVSVTGGGGLTIITNDGGTNGDFSFASAAFADFWDLSSSLTINGTAYTLENDLGTLASAIAASPSGAFALARNYDASVNGIYHQAPIMTELTGSFEGLGHAISNLAIHAPNSKRAALFDMTGFGAVLRDLTLASATIKGGDAGTLVGESAQSAVIQCAASGSVTGIGRIGGLVGSDTGGSVLRSHSSVTIHGTGTGGTASGGGLVGYMDYNQQQSAGIFNSYATGNVTSFEAGGLAGHWLGATIDQSYATGTVRAPDGGAAGGLVGTDMGTVTRSFATGAVSGGSEAAVGGVAGGSFSGGINLSFATGSVQGGDHAKVGGLLGYGFATIYDTYATGSVKGGPFSDNGGLVGLSAQDGAVTVSVSYSTGAVRGSDPSHTGGFEGAHDTGFDNSIDYWDVDTSKHGAKHGIGDCIQHRCSKGIKGLTTSELKSALPAGFDPAVWGQSAGINSGYPYLLANPPQ